MPGRPVYSVCFQFVDSDTAPPIYVVPAGDTAILKAMTFWLPAGPRAGGVLFQVTVDSGIVWDLSTFDLANGGVFQWSGWEVFTEEMRLLMSSVIHVFHWRASGTLLTPT